MQSRVVEREDRFKRCSWKHHQNWLHYRSCSKGSSLDTWEKMRSLVVELGEADWLEKWVSYVPADSAITQWHRGSQMTAGHRLSDWQRRCGLNTNLGSGLQNLLPKGSQMVLVQCWQSLTGSSVSSTGQTLLPGAPILPPSCNWMFFCLFYIEIDLVCSTAAGCPAQQTR